MIPKIFVKFPDGSKKTVINLTFCPDGRVAGIGFLEGGGMDGYSLYDKTCDPAINPAQEMFVECDQAIGRKAASLELCYQIEKCDASDAATIASTMASNLHGSLPG